MFSDRTNGSLLHDLELYKQTPGDPEKEVYDGNINQTKQNDASSVHHLIILVYQKNEQR